jgi:putative ABC transport system substrate-binding protein
LLRISKIALALAVALPVHAWGAGNGVVVVRSSDLGPYKEVEKAFLDALGRPAQTVTAANKDEVVSAVSGAGLIFCIGPAAAQLVTGAKPSGPVLYALVSNPGQLGLDRDRGATLFVPPPHQVKRIKVALPGVKTLGILYSPAQSKENEAEYEAAAKAAGLAVLSVPVSERSAVAEAARGMVGKVDAIWLMPDSVVVSADTFKFMVQLSLGSKLPLVGFSEAMARAGAVVAFEPDFSEIGRKLAGSAKRVLSGGSAKPETEGLMYLNVKSAEIIGTAVAPAARGLATKVFE